MIRELVVDNFAGGGGASTGIERALGRSPDIAINHSPEAIAMHTLNHPDTKHYCEDVWKVDPHEATQGRPVGLAWFSPDCTHFSKAKGGKPRSKKIRGLAWLVVRWAKAVKPRVIILENVEEFADWGPLLPNNLPCPMRKGFTYRRWWRTLENLGYELDARELRACDYGAPTFRKRLFIIARCDGRPIVWPEPTHGRGLLPYRTAAECIDWSLPCPSIFERERPLAEATLKRIARGIKKFILDNPAPFIVTTDRPVTNRSKPRGLDEVLPTATGNSRMAIVVPVLATLRGTSDAHLDASGHAVTEPLGTVSAQGTHHALVEPVLAPFITPVKTWGGGGNEPRGVDEVMRTITASKRGEFALVAPTLVQTGYGEREGQAPRALDIEKPLGTVVAGGQKHGLVAAFLAKHYTGVVGQGIDKTLGTITTKDHHSLVQAFLLKYYGTDQNPRLNEPLHTITSKDRFGLVTVHGEDYRIVDIGMRMLQPHELFRAQGFPADVKLLGTKTSQVRLCGNSVSPPMAEALVRANMLDVEQRAAA